MARITAATYKPQLQFRFQMSIDKLPNSLYYLKSSDLPIMSNNSIEIDYGNTSFHVKGKTRWNKLNCTMYAYEGMTYSELFEWANLHHFISSGTDLYKEDYEVGLIQLQLMKPSNTPVNTVKLHNAYLDEINYGQVDWSSNEPITPSMTIVYDYATIT
jgi:hypothetical protein